MSSLASRWENLTNYQSDCGLTIGWDSQEEEQILTTGSLGLDVALGIGGFPRGKLVEIYGEPASGKTTLALAAIAQAQKRSGRTAWMELECKLSKNWVRKSRVDPANMMLVRCSEAVPALRMILELVHSGGFEVVVIDSIAALLPYSDIEHGGDHCGEIERLLERALPLIASEASKTKTCVLLLNQVRTDREKVVFGDSTTTIGGHVLWHSCSVRIKLHKKLAIKTSNNAVLGSLHQATIKKNSLAAPYQVADLAYTHARGLDALYEAVSLGSKWGLFGPGPFDYAGTKLGTNDVKAYEFLLHNSDVANALLSDLSVCSHRRAVQSMSSEVGDVYTH